MRPYLLSAFAALALFSTPPAQAQDAFKTRLSPVPIDAQLAPVITGHGSATATLAGTRLTVNGSFEGMRSAATGAHLFQSKVIGVPGAKIGDLTVATSMAGNVSGSINLTPAQVDALRKGLLYVVVDSMGAPDGNLRGWLLK